MKLSQLKQIIKEEINEVGYLYPGKKETPSSYQLGIDDTLKVLKDLGILDVEDNVLALIKRKVLDPADEFPIPNDTPDGQPVNEATAKVKNLVLKSDNYGVSIKRKDPNDGGRVNSEIYISKIELPDVINFLNGAQ